MPRTITPTHPCRNAHRDLPSRTPIVRVSAQNGSIGSIELRLLRQVLFASHQKGSYRIRYRLGSQIFIIDKAWRRVYLETEPAPVCRASQVDACNRQRQVMGQEPASMGDILVKLAGLNMYLGKILSMCVSVVIRLG